MAKRKGDAGPTTKSKKKAKEDEVKTPIIGDESEGEEEDEVKHDPVELTYKITIPEWAHNFHEESSILVKHYDLAIQKLRWRFHITNRAAGTKNQKLVPPMHPDWPMHLFTENMPFEDFLIAICGFEQTREIMKWETDFESSMKHRLKKHPDITSPYFGKKLLWKSWSAMLQLELTYPELMYDCESWETCFEHMWKGYITSKKPEEYEKFVDPDLGDLALLNSLIQHVWRDSGVAEANSVTSLIRVKILSPTVKESKMFTEYHAEGAPLEQTWKALLRDGPLQIPTAVADQ